MNQILLLRVQEIAASVFDVPAEDLSAETTPQDIPAWDSLQQLNLVLALEEQFNLQLEPEVIERMVSIGAITAVIQEKLSISPSDAGSLNSPSN